MKHIKVRFMEIMLAWLKSVPNSKLKLQTALEDIRTRNLIICEMWVTEMK